MTRAQSWRIVRYAQGEILGVCAAVHFESRSKARDLGEQVCQSLDDGVNVHVRVVCSDLIGKLLCSRACLRARARGRAHVACMEDFAA